MEELSHYINGQHVKGTSGRFTDVFNPATGEVQAKVPLASVEEIDAAVAKAAEAQVAWGATNPQRRARVMMAFGQLINENMEALAETVSREHGKTLPDGRGDVQRGLEVIEVDGQRSEGFNTMALPQAIAGPIFHKGIIAGKLKGVMPATTPKGWRIE